MPAIDRIEDFRIVDAIARTGTLSGAARELDLSLTVVSKRLSRLEATLGLRLVQRTTRSLHFSDEGLLFLERCRDVLEAVAAAQDVGEDANDQGSVRITAAVGFAQRQIAPRLAKFADRYPGISIQILSTNPLIDLVEQQVDVAFRQAPLDNSAYITRTIAPDDELLCASPAYCEAHGVPAHPDELIQHRCLTVGDPPPRTWSLQKDEERLEVKVRSAMGASDGEIPHLAALQGCGIALKSSWEVVKDIRAGRLIRVLPQWWGRTRSVRVVFPIRRHQPARVRTFVDFMEQELRAEAARASDLGLFRDA
ncbi:LysR family transcriptional regulator [Novosphingobium profundi]|uniref:LysR family transcriptional regulator n=1 Tax=Novosphingobium profundi TaxID=1774954 RepID=UPI001BDA0F38|nr:LysR family transcriptional regulator [Novosphingobium profundi]MBT0670643.1 LysR family transcriptional regulator [Novosphingobium profundi]